MVRRIILRYYRIIDLNGDVNLFVETGDDVLESITSVENDIVDILDLIKSASYSGDTIDTLAGLILDSGNPEKTALSEVAFTFADIDQCDYTADRPFDPPEVWAAGVTYKNSEMERRRESETPDIYSNVYNADRPEIFFKSTSDRCMGPLEDVGIRSDSTWDVPEPELAFVTFKGEIIGYTIGNDMSSRSIEGENALYLPQAKVYEKSCAIGPCFITSESLGDPQKLNIECSIVRNGTQIFHDSTSTSQMARTCSEISEWLHKNNYVPDLTTVLTGTSIVPPPEFTLQSGDQVAITIDRIGVLENSVIEV